MPLRGAGTNENDVCKQDIAGEGLILGAAAVRAFGRLGRAAGGCDRPPLQQALFPVASWPFVAVVRCK